MRSRPAPVRRHGSGSNRSGVASPNAWAMPQGFGSSRGKRAARSLGFPGHVGVGVPEALLEALTMTQDARNASTEYHRTLPSASERRGC